MIMKATLSSHVTYYLVPLLWVHLLCPCIRADLIAYTSFEEPPAITGPYIDTQDPSTDHELLNNTGESLVSWTKTTELGFASFFTNTRNDVGLTDGDDVGVTSSSNSFHGSQVFQMSDTDGLMSTFLDTVSLKGFNNASVSLHLFTNSTTWELSDQVRIWTILDGNTELDLINTLGQDIDNLSMEGRWLEFTQSLAGYESAKLAFSLDSNAGPESILIDNIRFEGDKAPIPAPVPVPASSILGGLGLAYANWLRRRFKA
jgi:hypothetical protein